MFRIGHNGNIEISYSSLESSSSPSAQARLLPLIFRHLDGNCRSACRLVCKKWRDELDEKTGLFFCLHDRKRGNGAMAHRVAIERLKIKHLERYENYFSLRHAEKLKMAHCDGLLPANWFFEKLLGKAVNLTRLDLSGSFLYSLRLSPFGSSIITLNNLKVLTINFNALHFENYLHSPEPHCQKSSNNNSGSIMQKLWHGFLSTRYERIHTVQQKIDENISTILSKLRSPILKIFYVFSDPMGEEESCYAGYSYNWKKNILKKFIDEHNSTLEHLFLPNYNRLCSKDENFNEENESPIYPSLKTLELCLVQKGSKKPCKFLKNVLKNQNTLTHLSLKKTTIGNSTHSKSSILSKIILSNESTLTYVNLTISKLEQDVSDLSIFKNCSALQKIRIFLSEEIWRFEKFANVSKLPPFVSDVKICACVELQQNEFMEETKFSKLERLIITKIDFEDEISSPSEFFEQFCKKLLNLHSLTQITFNEIYLSTGSKTLNHFLSKLKGIDENYEIGDEIILKNLSIRKGVENYGDISEFLDIYPLIRVEIDPLAKFGKNNENRDKIEEIELIVESNIFKENLKTKNQEKEDEGSWLNFCTSYFSYE